MVSDPFPPLPLRPREFGEVPTPDHLLRGRPAIPRLHLLDEFHSVGVVASGPPRLNADYSLSRNHGIANGSLAISSE